ncbi:MAG: PilZ domain-containing protein [Planctomycetota bacterium]|nr:PilZ domain-containing protein [Planctomycetota bacterium]
MSTSDERREHPRYDIPCRLRVELPGGEDVRTRTLNVSSSGAYFVVDEVIPEVGHTVTVRLAVPRDTANTFFLEQFAAKAKVIRRDPAVSGDHPGVGVAVRFEKVLALDLP